VEKHYPQNHLPLIERENYVFHAAKYSITFKISRTKLQIITKKDEIWLIITKAEIFMGKYKL